MSESLPSLESPAAPIGPMASSFASVAGDRVPLQRLSKATLVDLSHVLEDMVVAHTRRGMVITGFQYARNWRSEVARYTGTLVTDDRRVGIFTRDRVPEAVGVAPFRIRKGSGFEQEWFILAITDAFCCALFGIDQMWPDTVDEEATRLFDAGWTFDPEVVRDLAALTLREASASDEQAASRFSAQIAELSFLDIPRWLNDHFHRGVFAAIERAKERLAESRRLEREASRGALEASQRNLRLERLSAIGGAAASFAHEVNNPLQAILANGEFLKEDLAEFLSEAAVAGSDVGETRLQLLEAADTVISAAERIASMTRAILDFARQTEATLEAVELVGWLRVETVSMVGGSSGRIDLAALGQDGVWIRADRHRLYHVLSNLVANGLREDRRTPPVVRIDLIVQAERVGIRVSDWGHGIPESIRASIFEPFVTGHRDAGGTGLGLPLAKRSAQEQDGTLVVESTGPEGTAFVLWLRSEEPDDRAADEVGARDAASVERLPASVLVFDDDPLVRQTLSRHLKRLGVFHVAVGTLADAEAAWAERSFEACLVDFDLGEALTGADVARVWSERGRLPASRMILVTGNLVETIPPEFEGEVLLKPFRHDDLRGKLLLVMGA